MVQSRRTFLKASAGISLAAAGMPLVTRVHAQTKPAYVLKYGNYQPTDHPNTVNAMRMAQKIADESKGRVELQVFPNSQLGSDTDMLWQLRAGGIDFISLAGATLGTLLPVAQIDAVGFAFKDYDTVWSAMDGDLGRYVREQIRTKTTLFAFDRIWDAGFRQITTSIAPVRMPDDLKGLKIRVPPTPLFTSMFQMFGASPTTVSMHDVYMALQTHIVTAQENPLVLISTSKLYETQKFCSMTDHMWQGFWMLGNQKRFAALPPDIQQIIARNVNEAAIGQRADTKRLDDSLAEQLKAKGMTFNTPQQAPFRDHLSKAGFYAMWKKRLGDDAWNILERYSGKMA